MARYLNNRELYACSNCGIDARRDEFITNNTIICPSCSHYSIYRQAACAVKEEGIENLYMGIPGLFTFAYMGFGEVRLPEIMIEESDWQLFPCETCREWHNINSCKIVTLYDPIRRNGFDRSKYSMPGIDIVQGGGTFHIPFSTEYRLWLNGEEINHLEFYHPEHRKWEYFLQHQ